ncbi:phage integrase central domain-containing protein [Phyllobacterium chamaecytisi]|uniref:phage integrase central domain-containing protein n=1 Tax=Phyllobacterium chamaecytisi TaxID=2876082 RepID=UPI00402715FE
MVPLRGVEAQENYETARRLHSTISQVFGYAIATARATNDPASGLRGALISPTAMHRTAVTARPAFEKLVRVIWY